MWVDGRKLAAIGVHVSSGWITSHGFALTSAVRWFERVYGRTAVEG